MLSFDNLIIYSNIRALFKIVNTAPPPLQKCIQRCSEQTWVSQSTAQKLHPPRYPAFAVIYLKEPAGGVCS